MAWCCAAGLRRRFAQTAMPSSCCTGAPTMAQAGPDQATCFWTRALGGVDARWKYGMRFDDVSPRQTVAESRTPVLLINDLADTNLLPHNSREIFAARQNGSPIELWEVPGATHCGARSAAPEEFDRRVLTWLAAHGSIPASHAPAGRDPSPSPSTR